MLRVKVSFITTHKLKYSATHLTAPLSPVRFKGTARQIWKLTTTLAQMKLRTKQDLNCKQPLVSSDGGTMHDALQSHDGSCSSVREKHIQSIAWWSTLIPAHLAIDFHAVEKIQ